MSSSRGRDKMIKKRTRNRLSLDVKLNIIQMLEKGHKVNSVARLYNLNESTIRTINKSADAIKTSIQEAIPTSSKLVKYRRDTIIVKMEKVLLEWLEYNNKNHIGLTIRIIQSKALSIFNELKENDENKERKEKPINFVASKGWFDKFKKRYNMHNILFVNESARAQKDDGAEFMNSFQVLIEEDNKVSNLDEIELKEEIVEEFESEQNGFCENATEEIVQVKQEIVEEKPDDHFVDELTPDLFTTQNISKCLSTIQKVIDFIEIIDPDGERGRSIGRGLKAEIAPYDLILAERMRTANQPTR